MANTRKRSPARKTTARSPSIKRTTPARARPASRRRRSARGRRSSWPIWMAMPPRLPELDQRQRDVIGLGLIALGIFMGFILWGHWDGGGAGHGLAVGLGWTVGKAR